MPRERNTFEASVRRPATAFCMATSLTHLSLSPRSSSGVARSTLISRRVFIRSWALSSTSWRALVTVSALAIDPGLDLMSWSSVSPVIMARSLMSAFDFEMRWLLKLFLPPNPSKSCWTSSGALMVFGLNDFVVTPLPVLKPVPENGMFSIWRLNSLTSFGVLNCSSFGSFSLWIFICSCGCENLALSVSPAACASWRNAISSVAGFSMPYKSATPWRCFSPSDFRCAKIASSDTAGAVIFSLSKNAVVPSSSLAWILPNDVLPVSSAFWPLISTCFPVWFDSR